MEFAFAGAVLGGFEYGVEGGAVEVFSVKPDSLNFRGVVDVSKGIGGKENKVGTPAGSNDAKFFGAAEKLSWPESPGLQRGERSESGFNKKSKFIMQAGAVFKYAPVEAPAKITKPMLRTATF